MMLAGDTLKGHSIKKYPLFKDAYVWSNLRVSHFENNLRNCSLKLFLWVE